MLAIDLDDIDQFVADDDLELNHDLDHDVDEHPDVDEHDHEHTDEHCNFDDQLG